MVSGTEAAPIHHPLETVTPIRPSEAIRLGCLTTLQTFGIWKQERGGRMYACALGAAEIGGLPLYKLDRALHGHVPPVCPVEEGDFGLGVANFVSDVIWHLNDYHEWSREAIADWLEGHGV